MSGCSENLSVRTTPKQSLKRVEIPLSNFKDVAVPYHIDLLKKHKVNIEKFQRLGDWDRVHHEQINATRLIKQLKALLYEMDTLRSQVQDSDVEQFDQLTDQARKNAQDALEEYLVLNPQGQKPAWVTSGDDISVSNIKNVTVDRETAPVLQQTSELHVQISRSALSEEVEKQEQCLKSWENLQTEVQDIHQLFEDFSLMVQQQKKKTDEIEDNVEEAFENVKEGASHIARAAQFRSSVYPIVGAVIGGCLGGPIGLIAGMKLGGLAAVSCGFIGFAGAQFLKKKQLTEASKSDVELVNVERSCNLQGSLPLPHVHGTQ